MIAKLSLDALKLDNRKPTQVVHSVQLSNDPITNIPQLHSQSYDNRVRRNKVPYVTCSHGHLITEQIQNVRVEVHDGTANYRAYGSVTGSHGRKNLVETSRTLRGAAVMKVTTYGREDPTSAEAQRAATVLRILQGSLDLLDDNPWIKNIWYPQDDGLMTWPEDWSLPTQSRSKTVPSQIPSLSQSRLNTSQETAVNTMLSPSDAHRIVLVQGPPGTGKTSVIAAFVQSSLALGKTGIWLVAQSNVAVKNIAEKLIKVEFFDWRLLVSHDFHFEWLVHPSD
jgi:primosomal protein N'